jgi:hypothetical protein
MSSEPSEPAEFVTTPRQPYPGLRPFDEAEQRLFFGRDHQIREILKRLQQTYFAVVIGGSGSGKSSIVNAGVVPALRKKQLRGSGDFWLAARFTPKDRPLRYLAAALAEFIDPKPGQSPDETVEDIEQTLLETNSLAGFLRRYRNHLKLEEGQAPESRENANLLIFCDQFEEIFREQNRYNPETRQLVDLIVEAHRNRDDYPQLYVIIGMRSEDLHRCAQFIDLPNVVNEASFLTRRLDEVEIASAIIEPIRLVLRLRGIKPTRFEPIEVDPWPFEVDLLRRLNKAVSSLAYDPDHLPLLQHLLSVLWRHVEEKLALQGEALKNPAAAEAFRITADDLAPALGFSTIAEADEFAARNKRPDRWILERGLDLAAEGVMPEDDRLKRITEMMFRLLAWVDDRGNYTRRWTTRAEIAGVTRDLTPGKRRGIARLLHGLRQRLRGQRAEDDDRPASDDEIEAVIGAFTARYPFLFVRTGREGKIDVSHEAFIRNWETFRAWLNDERSLALAFGSLRTAYAHWREKLVDPHRRWLGWLSGIFGDRLSGERLYRMRDWSTYRSHNAAWAALYAGGVDSQEAESEHRQPNQISEGTLRLLRRYYWKSLGIRYSLVAWPWVVTGLALVAGGYLFESRRQVDQSKIQVAALTPYIVAEAVIKGVERRRSDWGIDERQANALVFESAVALDILRNIQKPKTGALELYRKFRQADDPSLVYVASVLVDKAARETLGSAMWPVPDSPPKNPASPARAQPVQDFKTLRPECQATTKKFLRAQTGDDLAEPGLIRHVRAPGDSTGDRRLLVAQSPETSLNFLLLSPERDCPVQSVFSLGIPPNSDLEIDPSLRLIVMNQKAGGTFLYRLDWIRRCRHDNGSQTCDVDLGLDWVLTLHDKGPYHVVDSSHVKVNSSHAGGREQQYQLGRDYKATLLPRRQAERARESFRAPVGKVVCDRRGPYVALLTAEKGGDEFDVLRILSVKGEGPCEDHAEDRTVLMTFDLRAYSIRNVAFAKEGSTIDPPDDVPDQIYLQSEEPNVVYSLAWKLATLRSKMCDIVRKQNGDRVPSANELPISVEVREALNKRDDYTPVEICN